MKRLESIIFITLTIVLASTFAGLYLIKANPYTYLAGSAVYFTTLFIFRLVVDEAKHSVDLIKIELKKQTLLKQAYQSMLLDNFK